MEHPKEATVLVVGGGGRCHAIVDALSRSPQVGKIYCAPGNAGIAAQAECVPFKETQVEQLRDFASERGVDLTVVGPEVALAAGIVDVFTACRRDCGRVHCRRAAYLRPVQSCGRHRIQQGFRQAADGQIQCSDCRLPYIRRL